MKSNIIDTVVGRIESIFFDILAQLADARAGRLRRPVQRAINSVYVLIGVAPEPAARKPGSFAGRRLVPAAGDLCRTTARISRRGARQSTLHAVLRQDIYQS